MNSQKENLEKKCLNVLVFESDESVQLMTLLLWQIRLATVPFRFTSDLVGDGPTTTELREKANNPTHRVICFSVSYVLSRDFGVSANTQPFIYCFHTVTESLLD